MEAGSDKRIEEMAKEAFLLRREIAIIAIVFFVLIILTALFVVGSLTTTEIYY